MPESRRPDRRRPAARLEAKERATAAFFDLAERMSQTSDPAGQKRLKEELARMTFGEE
jgi:hypothetical protein